jgi:DNA-directed RNA polymerase specialized sigma24 family protein
MRALLLDSGPSYAEIADKLRIPVGSIGPTRDRALARLRRDDQLIAAR